MIRFALGFILMLVSTSFGFSAIGFSIWGAGVILATLGASKLDLRDRMTLISVKDI